MQRGFGPWCWIPGRHYAMILGGGMYWSRLKSSPRFWTGPVWFTRPVHNCWDSCLAHTYQFEHEGRRGKTLRKPILQQLPHAANRDVHPKLTLWSSGCEHLATYVEEDLYVHKLHLNVEILPSKSVLPTSPKDIPPVLSSLDKDVDCRSSHCPLKYYSRSCSCYRRQANDKKGLWCTICCAGLTSRTLTQSRNTTVSPTIFAKRTVLPHTVQGSKVTHLMKALSKSSLERRLYKNATPGKQLSQQCIEWSHIVPRGLIGEVWGSCGWYCLILGEWPMYSSEEVHSCLIPSDVEVLNRHWGGNVRWLAFRTGPSRALFHCLRRVRYPPPNFSYIDTIKVV